MFNNYKVFLIVSSGISKEQIIRKSFDKDEITNTIKSC